MNPTKKRDITAIDITLQLSHFALQSYKYITKNFDIKMIFRFNILKTLYTFICIIFLLQILY